MVLTAWSYLDSGVPGQALAFALHTVSGLRDNSEADSILQLRSIPEVRLVVTLLSRGCQKPLHSASDYVRAEVSGAHQSS